MQSIYAPTMCYGPSKDLRKKHVRICVHKLRHFHVNLHFFVVVVVLKCACLSIFCLGEESLKLRSLVPCESL